ncbi:MAG: FixH family protein [Verrucomicrobia bacterium]|nr:FixH family protein [Verrucomicrobiota bacterium]
MKSPLSRWHPWPLAILAWFAGFSTFTAGFIIFAVGQKTDLVRPDYYDQEIRFQEQIDRLKATRPLRAQVTVSYDASRHCVHIHLPTAQAVRSISGRIRFYRPSDASLDRDVPLAVDSAGLQVVHVAEWRRGLWRVRLEWTVDGQGYYYDQAIVVSMNGPTSTRWNRVSRSIDRWTAACPPSRFVAMRHVRRRTWGLSMSLLSVGPSCRSAWRRSSAALPSS